MKLRNKKTGEIVDLSEGFIKDTYNGEMIQLKPVAISNKEGYLYASLAELNEEWEDYAPAEPLIKDEDVRRLIRSWSKLNSVKHLTYDSGWNAFRGDGFVITFNYDFDGQDGLIDEGEYSIEELCGEDKQ